MTAEPEEGRTRTIPLQMLNEPGPYEPGRSSTAGALGRKSQWNNMRHAGRDHHRAGPGEHRVPGSPGTNPLIPNLGIVNLVLAGRW